MSDTQKLVVVVTNGLDNERSSVAWSVANGGIASGFEVTMFLVSSGVDWVRKGAASAAPSVESPHVLDRVGPESPYLHDQGPRRTPSCRWPPVLHTPMPRTEERPTSILPGPFAPRIRPCAVGQHER